MKTNTLVFIQDNFGGHFWVNGTSHVPELCHVCRAKSGWRVTPIIKKLYPDLAKEE